jgi:hypothetical protein
MEDTRLIQAIQTNSKNAINPERFVKHSATDKVFAVLDDVVQQKTIATLTGVHGSGKSALVHEWINGKTRNTLYIWLRPELDKTLPITVILFGRLLEALNDAARPAMTIRHGVEHDELSIRSKRDLDAVRKKVIKRLEDRGTTTVIIDNAHLMDKHAGTWSLDLVTDGRHREPGSRRRALIFVATTDGRKDSPPGLYTWLDAVPEADSLWTGKYELERLPIIDFMPVWAKLWKQNLKAIPAPGLSKERLQKIATEDRRLTRGDWYIMKRLAYAYDRALGPWDGKNFRLITEEVASQAHAILAERRM